MNINATLLGQAITFAVLIWFTVKFVWPPLLAAIEERRQTIADGLASADRGKHDLELAAKRAADAIREAKEKAADIVAQAEKRGQQLVEEAKQAAQAEGARQLVAAKAEIEQEAVKVREALRQRVADLAVAGAEKILRREVDAKAHASLLADIGREL